ncbi:MAG: hypothetical protein IKS48_11885 [Eubacterium sp.]|nr:hypothetical protein [Eubacterium sp.]
MRKLRKLCKTMILGTLLAAMLSTQVNAQPEFKHHIKKSSEEESEIDIVMPTFEKVPDFDSLFYGDKEISILEALYDYNESAMRIIDNYYDNKALNAYVAYYVPLEFPLFDLRSMKENGHGEFKIAGKTFDNGLWAIQWYDDFESCVVECKKSEFKEVLSNLDMSKWKKTGNDKYETIHGDDEMYYVIKYNSKSKILTVTRYSAIREEENMRFINVA